MRNVVLFIAMSLDGFIADSHGNVDWLQGQSDDVETMDTYSVFIKDIDTVVMGWKTYHQIVTELSPEAWVYDGMTSYVITHKACVSTEEIKFTSENPANLIRKLKQEKGKDIWICGGADIVQQVLKKNLIDKFYISVIPTLLGKGIPLFGTMEQEIRLELIQTQNYNGITDLVYKRR